MTQVSALMKLLDLPEGKTATVAKFRHLNDDDKSKLSGLGMKLGCPVRVLTRALSGPLLLAINDARLAINQEVAAQILVFKSEE